jgi:hypothetical protein
VTTAYAFDGTRFRPMDWAAQRALRWAAWRPDGSVALLAGNGGSALLYDGTRTEFLTTTTRQNLRGAAWSPDGMTALLVGNRGAVLRLRGEAVEELEASTAENLRRVAWHPSGAYALIVGNAGTVLRYDSREDALAPLPADRAHTLRSIAFRPDGAYALVGAYASRWAGYPRPHALYRCDGRYVQALLASDDEDDFVGIDWRRDGEALVCGYAWRPDGSMVNKALLYDGSTWQAHAWASSKVVLGGGWQPSTSSALLVGESGLAVQVSREGGVTALDSETTDNLIGPFWRPDGAYAIVLKGPGERVYTV